MYITQKGDISFIYQLFILITIGNVNENRNVRLISFGPVIHFHEMNTTNITRDAFKNLFPRMFIVVLFILEKNWTQSTVILG